MSNKIKIVFLLALCIGMLNACVSKRKRGETSKLGKFYHNVTAKYNGYFNANEIMKETMLQLQSAHQDNYTQIIDVYDYVEVENPKAVSGELDKAIEKVTTVAALHEPSNYVDDCYVLMGKAQFLKHEFETAEETFEYFREDFNPSNPYGRNYQKKKLSAGQKRKLREEEKNEERKLKQEERERKEKIKEEEREAKEKAREEEKKRREEEREAKKKKREEEKKRREKEREERKKNKKRGRRDAKKLETAKSKETKSEEVKEESSEEETKKEEIRPKLNTSPVEEEEEEEDIPPKKKEEDKEVEHDKTSYSEGLLWLARTYIERQRYSSAQYLLNSLDADAGVNDDVKREISPARAKLELEQENYDAAIPHLREAIKTANKGHLKARYSFIIGQILQRSGAYAGALDAFKKVKDYGGDFVMEFNADLNITKNEILTNNRSKDEAIKKMEKMLKERKYETFRDQIFYTMGEIELSQDNFAQALDYFQKSIANNKNNQPLKVETYYKLANLFFEKEAYVDAKYYFDSTLTVMTKEDPRYNTSSDYAANLQEIATNIEIINEQDSLISLSRLSEAEQREYALQVLAEEKETVKNAEKNSKAAEAESNIRPSSRRTFGRSNFFAYNIAVKQKGIKDFEEKWGNRPLEDNWRRSDKQSEIADNGSNRDVVLDEEVEEQVSEGDIERILNTIPNNPAKMAKADKKLQDALFDLGTAYRDRIRKYQKSATTLERLVHDYPQYEKELDAFYYLYLDYLDLNQPASAKSYYDKIVTNYPETKYAQALQDPDYAQKMLDADQQVENFYNDTYDYFTAGEHEMVLQRIEETTDLFGKDNKLKPKFGLLKAMSLGSMEGQDAYIKELQAVITKFPNSPEQIKAKEILRFLKGDSEAFSIVQAEEVDGIFDLEDDKLHYLAVIVFDSSQEKFDQAKISVSAYNKTYHKSKRLQMSGDIFLNKDEGVQMFIVRKFIDRAKAMEYYNEIQKDKNTFIDESIVNYELFPVTQRNYRKIIREKSINVYRAFFEKNYLKG